MMILLIPATLAIGGESASYDIETYHYGSAGGLGESPSYDLRHTTTYQQGSTGDASSATYSMNVGHFESEEDDLFGPTVTLNSPADNSYSSISSVEFNVTVSDNNNIANVTLYGNWSGSWQPEIININSSNNIDYILSDTLPEGNWIWNVEACDNSGNCAFGTPNRSISVDLNNPTVTLISPLNDSTWSPSNTVLFQYNTSDVVGFGYVELYVDGIFLLNETAPVNGVNTFTRQLSNGVYNWSVKVYDAAGRLNQSDTYTFTVSVSTGGGSGGISPDVEDDKELPLIFEDVDREFKISDTQKKLFMWFLIVYGWWLIFGKKKKKKISEDLFVR